MKKTTFQFEYDIPDEYLYQTNVKKLKGKWTYVGPEKLYVFVNPTTGELEYTSSYVAVDPEHEEDSKRFAETMAGFNHKVVLVEARKEPIIATIFMPAPLASELPQKEYRLPNGKLYYSRPEFQYMDHTYEVGEIRYDLEKNEWVKPFPWKKPHINWEQLEEARQRVLTGLEESLQSGEYEPDMILKLKAMKAELDAIPTTYAGIDPWKVPFPIDPRSPAIPDDLPRT